MGFYNYMHYFLKMHILASILKKKIWLLLTVNTASFFLLPKLHTLYNPFPYNQKMYGKVLSTIKPKHN